MIPRGPIHLYSSRALFTQRKSQPASHSLSGGSLFHHLCVQRSRDAFPFPFFLHRLWTHTRSLGLKRIQVDQAKNPSTVLIQLTVDKRDTQMRLGWFLQQHACGLGTPPSSNEVKKKSAHLGKANLMIPFSENELFTLFSF